MAQPTKQRTSYQDRSATVRQASHVKPRDEKVQDANIAKRRSSQSAKKKGVFERIVSNKVVLGIFAVVLVFVVAVSLDAAVNWGKAFGNVSVNGVSVGGMTKDEINNTLKSEFGSRVSHAQISIFANEQAKSRGVVPASEGDTATAEQISAEEAAASVDAWVTDAQSLKANVLYDKAANEALEVGRSEGGLPARLGLLFGGKDVDLNVSLEIGDPRVDTSVYVSGGEASVVQGHDGTMVDRAWLESSISRAMVKGDAPDSFVVVATPAPSRITMQQAQEMADAVNRAIAPGAVFKYQGRTWKATSLEVGNWTEVAVAGEEGSWRLEPHINSSVAIPAVVKGADAAITSDSITVEFEKSGSDIMVRTAGTGNIPEVAPAVTQLDELLYGANGSAWKQAAGDPAEVTIGESDRPETLSFNDALDLGVITVIGEYTTEFSNLEGTENRNHNIKLAADILTDAVIEANGGDWNFNERSGDTNEEAGFWSAGSIVNGEFIDSIGGGICQVATTIFNAVYEAGLDVTERHNHTLYIASYPTGRDAAVSYPDLDFIWENNLKSDILMKLSYTDTSITAQLYSVYTGMSATTETGEWQDGKKYSVTFERDDSLASGYYYLKTVGEDGSKIVIERTVHDKNGKDLKTEAFASEYAPKDQVYVIGPDVDTSNLVRKDSGSSSSSADAGHSDWY